VESLTGKEYAMDTPGIPSRTRHPRPTTLHICAITLSVVSGTYALVALAAGSPLEFGVAVAFCAAWLIAADFIETNVEREREHAARGYAVPASQPTQQCLLPSAGL
jgi:uncharacterized membrane protein